MKEVTYTILKAALEDLYNKRAEIDAAIDAVEKLCPEKTPEQIVPVKIKRPREIIEDFLGLHKEPVETCRIINECKLRAKQVSLVLHRMKKEGLVDNPVRGKWLLL